MQIPDDLLQKLQDNPAALAKFNAMSVSHQKEYTSWIEDAKKPETRARRIEITIEMILAKEK